MRNTVQVNTNFQPEKCTIFDRQGNVVSLYLENLRLYCVPENTISSCFGRLLTVMMIDENAANNPVLSLRGFSPLLEPNVGKRVSKGGVQKKHGNSWEESTMLARPG